MADRAAKPVPSEEVPHGQVQAKEVRLDIAGRGTVSRVRIVWEESKVGYVTSTEPDNDFGLMNDVGIVTVATAAQNTLFTWEQYYDHRDLAAARASFDDGIADIGQRAGQQVRWSRARAICRWLVRDEARERPRASFPHT